MSYTTCEIAEHAASNMATANKDSETIEIDDIESDTLIKTTSHKGEKVKVYSVKFKMDAINFATRNSISASARKFNVDRKTIREWMQKRNSIEELSKRSGASRKRLDGAGRKPVSVALEERLFTWFEDRRSKRLRVSRKLLMKKAALMYREMKEARTIAHDGDFVASRGWLDNFLKRNGLSLRRKTAVAQKDPNQLIGRCLYPLLSF